MAEPRHPQSVVNYSRYVAARPRVRLAARRLTGNSVSDLLLTDGCCIRSEHSKHRPAGSRRSDSPDFLEDLPMSDAVKVGFVPFSTAPPRGILVIFCDDALKFGPATGKALGDAPGLVKRAAATNQFKGKSGSTLDILAPEGLKASRLIVVGAGKVSAIKANDFLKLGGAAAGKLGAGTGAVMIIAELPDGAMKQEQAAAVAAGIRLRAYKFDRYKTKKKDGEDAALHA